MSGRVLRILSRTDYDYSSLGASASTAEIPIALDVDVSGSRETTLLVRAHSQALQSTAAFTIVTRASAPTDQDPNAYFRDASPLTTTALAATATPFLTRITVPANAGAWLSVFIKATQGTTGGASVKGTFSIDLSLKD
ncbi:MAG: hypothetical protein K8H88_27230 [Sandaracinaceae bacterium]|nr:hypothetical protein [Sandaracinaceae bacterium]